MNSNKKKQIIYLSTFIAFIIISIAVGTYAFFDFGEINAGGDLPLGTVTGSGATFTAYSEGNIELNVNKDVMTKDVSSTTAAASNNSTIHISLDGGTGNSSTTCTYDLIWVWDVEDEYKESTVELPYTHTDGVVYPYEFSVTVGTKETNLSDFTWNDNKAIIATKSIRALGGEINTDDYEVLVNFYNLPVRQNALSGKIYQGHIEISDARCSASPTIAAVAKDGDLLSDAIKALYTEDGDNGLYLHDGIGTYTNANLEAGDNSYRYAGTNPNNFVCFAEDCTNYDNLYRIIGVFDGQVKLIKADFANSNLLGEDGDYSTSLSNPVTNASLANYMARGKLTTINNYYWNKVNQAQAAIENSGNSNIWSYSELNKTNLNENFVGNIESTYLSMIDDTTQWIVSGGPWRKLYGYDSETNAKIAYDYEIAETCPTCDNTKEIRVLSEPTKIGLMYVSDYYYAATPYNWSLSGYNESDATATQDYRAAIAENWMYLGVYEWTISRVSAGTNYAFNVYNVGVVYNHDVSNSIYNGVRPTFYLKSSVVYEGGAGTENDPIRISYEPTVAEKVVSLYKGQGTVVGDGVLYLHDSTLENGAEDNSYRYSGAGPDNYVCFEGDTCDDAHKYRIIGIIDGRVKLIKHTSLGNMAWNSSGNNTWEGSSLEKYLNETWLPILDYADLIDMTTWKVGGMSWDLNRTAKNYYDVEKADTTTLNRKIGLMYPSDYGYAATNGYWTTSLNAYNGEAHNNDWLYINNTYQWFVSRRSDVSNTVFVAYGTGHVHLSALTASLAARPVFYLTSDAVVKDGEGSSENPYIIGT